MKVQCPVCGKRFRNEQGLGGHLRHSKDPDHLAPRAGLVSGRPALPPRATPPTPSRLNSVRARPPLPTGGKPLPSSSGSTTPPRVAAPIPSYPPALLQYSQADRLRAHAATLRPAWPYATPLAAEARAQPVARPQPAKRRTASVEADDAYAKGLELLLEWIGRAAVKILRSLFSEPPRPPPPPRREPTYWEQVLGTRLPGGNDD